MDEETVLLCSGDRQRLLLDLDALGYRVRALPAEAGKLEAYHQVSDSVDAGAIAGLDVATRQRYCHTRSLDRALQEMLSHRRPVLVSGETGTGKEVLARALNEHSCASTEFPVIHCQALRWGITEGCYTRCIEDRIQTALRAKPALLLLDEVGDMGRECQRAALKLLADADHASTRIVVTSNRPIESLLEHGDILPDFVEKLDLSHISLQPLRNQPAEIPVLLEWFVSKANGELGTSIDGLTPAAIREAVSYNWPGNTREMRNVVFQSMLQQPTGRLEKLLIEEPQGDLSPTLASLIRRNLPAGNDADAQTLMQQFERELLQALHELHGGNKSRIARALRVSRNTLKSRLRAHNL